MTNPMQLAEARFLAPGGLTLDGIQRALDALMHLRERKGSALTIVFKDGSQYTVIEGTAEQAEAA